MTEAELFSDDTIIELFSLESIDRIKRKRELIEEARKAGCKSDFEKYIREYERDEKRQSKSNKVVSINGASSVSDGNYTNFSYPELKEQLICNDFIANDNGIGILNGKTLDKITEAPVLPIRQYYNPFRDTYKITLAYVKDGEWREGTWYAGDIFESNKLVRLSNNGLPVISKNAKELSAYIMHIMSNNKFEPIPCTDKLGWVGDNFSEFAPYTSNYELDVTLQQAMKNTLIAKGDYDVWLNNMREHRKQKREELNILLAASFASPMLGICNALPFWVHLHGFTGVGKTVCLMASASIWGNPSPDAELVSGFRSSTIGAEIRADMLNNIPAFMDDTAEIKNSYAGNFGDLIYMLCSGQGKVRGNKDLNLRDSKTWKNVTISTGETPITTEKSRGGEINRVIEIQTGKGKIFEDGAKEVEILKNNYGFAGREFIRILTQELCPEMIREEFDIIRRRLKDKTNGQNVLEKQLNSFAMLLLADKIATEYIFCDGIYLDEDKFIAMLKTTEEADTMLNAYKRISDMIITSRNRHFNDYSNEFWGRLVKSPTGLQTIVHILPNSFNELCEKCEVNPKEMKNYLFDKGLLEGTQDKRQPDGFRKDKLETFGEIRTRFIVFYLFYESDSLQ